LSDEFFQKEFEGLVNRNIFWVRSSKIQEDLLNSSPYVKEVVVEKQIPDTLIFTVTEREPKFVWVNLAGAYLLDGEGHVLEIASDFENLQLASEEIDLLKGYGNLQEVAEQPKEESEDEVLEENEGTTDDAASAEEEAGSETESIEVEETDKSEKIKKVEEQQKEMASRVEHFWIEQFKNMGEKYEIYPVIYSYQVSDLKVRDTLDITIVSGIQAGIELEFFEDIYRYIWESDYRFVIYITPTKKIIFSTRREFETQINDLRIILTKLKQDGVSFKMIDLSSEMIVYERE
jgi:hypothetical protein